ncbi:histidine kinase [Taibaiella koreensis]|uniref:histidine kinase n=1 Tax=Taibaiella koreensis TaxID=1268548 RepID=UPI000E59B634|nr:histidine kinase [Taibaiella koreensis]
MRKLSALIGFLLLGYNSGSQPGSYIQYTTVNGLLSNKLYDIVQDRDGFIWLSGNSGVYRFDGTYFRNFSIADGLPDNEVLKLFQDSYGRIWFFCFNGRIAYYQNGRFRNDANDSILAGIQLKNIPVSFYEGKNNLLHILVQNGSYVLLKINATGIVSSKIVHAPASCYWEDRTDRYYLHRDSIFKNGKCLFGIAPSLSANMPQYAYTDHNTLYYPGRKGIYLFRNDHFRLLLPAVRSAGPIKKFYVNGANEIFTFNNGGGVTRWQKTAGVFRLIDSYPDPKNEGKILVDRQNGVWITTLTQGLYYYPSDSRNWRMVPPRSNWPGKIVTDMFMTSEGKIILGFESGNVAMADKDFDVQEAYRLTGANQYLPVRDIRMTAGRQIVVSGASRCLVKQHSKAAAIGAFKDIETDGQKVYFATMTDLGWLDPATGRSSLFHTERGKGLGTRKYAVWPATGSDRLWYSSIEGLQLLERGKKMPLPGRGHPFLQKRIIDIREMGQGLLVLVSDGEGVALTDKDGNVLQVLSGRELHYGLIGKAFVEGDKLWLAGTAGIGIFQLRGNKLVPQYWIDKNSGLQSNDVRAFCVDREFLYASTNGGLQKLSRTALLKKAGTPRLFLHALESGSKVWTAYGAQIALPPRCREIRLHCSALAFGNTARAVFAYRFGPSGNFIETSDPILTIPVGFDGKEALFLKCRKGDSEWSQAAVLRLYVPVPWHRQTAAVALFFIVAVLTASSLSMYFVNRLRKRQMNMKDLKLQVALLEISALQSSMNPHFVFNALNSVQHFVNEGNAYEVNKYLTKFSRLLRRNLNNNTASLISLEKELAGLRDYLELEQLRFGKMLQFTITIDEHIPAEYTMIPAMLVQPLVENAILHGIPDTGYTGHVDIDISAVSNRLLIRIRDNGKGLMVRPEENDEHRSLGIQTIKSRLALLGEIYKEHYAFHLYANEDVKGSKGVTARLELPLVIRP